MSRTLWSDRSMMLIALNWLDGFVLLEESPAWRHRLGRVIYVDVNLVAWEVQVVYRGILLQASSVLKVALVEWFVLAACIAKSIKSDADWTTLRSLHFKWGSICCCYGGLLTVVVLVNTANVHFHVPRHVLSETSFGLRRIDALRESLVLQGRPRLHLAASARTHSHGICNPQAWRWSVKRWETFRRVWAIVASQITCFCCQYGALVST